MVDLGPDVIKAEKKYIGKQRAEYSAGNYLLKRMVVKLDSCYSLQDAKDY